MSAAIRTEFTSQQGIAGLLISLFYCVVVFGAMLMVRLSRQRDRERTRAAALALRASQLEAQVTQAHLKTLQMQFNPHFLFNALNSVASLIQQQRTDDAYHAVALLGNLLRDSMDSGRRQTIPLHEELEFLQRYLELERLRFSDRLAVRIDVAEDCRDSSVPAMLLQPLVENAIRHAVSAVERSVGIELSARREDGRLHLEITDDGPGLPPGWRLDAHAGVGLDNVRRRLEAHHPGDFGLQVLDRQPSGVAVRISLPYKEGT
jgi:LytS/YehU family sensor histidine kinase